jgi:hypothetical protein
MTVMSNIRPDKLRLTLKRHLHALYVNAPLANVEIQL